MLGVELLIALLVFVGMMVVSGVVVAVWIVVTLVRAVICGIMRLLFIPPRPPGGKICPRTLCRAHNPSQARYCRRCGLELSQRQFGEERWPISMESSR